MKLLDLNTESDFARRREVYLGGPVECDCGIVLHTDDSRDNILIETPNSILVSSDSEILTQIATGRGPTQSMFFLGYTGWDIGQVEEEIKNNDWLMLPYSEGFLFKTHEIDLWQKAIDKIGITGNFFSKIIGHA
jgi:putative transcriptional regulator